MGEWTWPPPHCSALSCGLTAEEEEEEEDDEDGGGGGGGELLEPDGSVSAHICITNSRRWRTTLRPRLYMIDFIPHL